MSGPMGPPRLQGPKGEPGIQGPSVQKGERRETGTSGIPGDSRYDVLQELERVRMERPDDEKDHGLIKPSMFTGLEPGHTATGAATSPVYCFKTSRCDKAFVRCTNSEFGRVGM
ncbi:hypothetical protein ACROYT_G012906 [Oculina patagonica]